MKINEILIYKIIFFLIAAAFLYISVVNIFAYPIAHYDDAAYAAVAKNLAFGYGYSSYLLNGGELVRFNPMISTGPTVILPAALFIKIFGNKLWVPGASAALVNIILLYFIFLLPKKFNIARGSLLWAWCAVFIGLLFITSSLGGLEKWACFNQMYASMFGEVPAALFIILSLFVLVYSKQTALNLIFSGALAGFAVKSKLISMLHICAMVFFVFAWRYKKGAPLRQNIKELFYYFAGLFIPYVLFDIYKLIAFGSLDSYLTLKKQEISFIVKFNSGLDSLSAFIPKAVNAVKILKNSFGLLKILFCLALAYYSVRVLVTKAYDNKNRLFADALIFAFVCNLTWYVFFSSQPFVRHLLIGWIMLIFGVSFYMVTLNSSKQKVIYFVIILFIITTALKPAYKAARNFNFSFDFGYVRDIYKVKNFIEENRQYSYFAAGWWIPWEVDYLLPYGENFNNITQIGKFNGLKNKVLISNKRFYNLYPVPMVAYLKNVSDTQKLYENDNYVVSKIPNFIQIAE
jgi:hypothetical protein